MRIRPRWGLLFLVPFLFDLWLILVRYRNYVPGPPPDELLYYTAGGIYIEGIRRLDFSVFLFNSEHPPLSKLFIGLFRLILNPLGLDVYPIPVRLCTSFFLGLTCIGTYELGEKIGDMRVGLTSWFLYIIAIFSTPLELWLGRKEISGIVFRWDLGVPLMPIDYPCLFFSLFCVYYAFDYGRKNNIPLKVGLLLGLAALSKFTAIPILSSLIALWMIYKKTDFKAFIRDYSIILGVASIVFYAGNPVIWNPLNVMSVLKQSAGHKQLDLRYGVFLSSPKVLSLEPGVGGWAWFLADLLFYPLALFIDSPLFTLFPLAIIYATLKQIPLNDAQFLVLLWFSIAYITIFQFAWTIVLGSYFVNYYVVAMFPPLALYCSLILVKPNQEMEREDLP